LLFRDITYIKQLELESKINEGLATAGKLAGWLAHEIRNPLSAINTSIYVLSSENMDCKEGDYARLIGIIATEVRKLDNLVSDFLGL
jgi:His Kinase A (phosphoacceptor) domain.